MRDDVVSSTIQLILNSPPEEQAYIGLRLWDSLHNITNSFEDKQPLLQVAVWTIGEYGDLVLNSERIEGNVGLYDCLDVVRSHTPRLALGPHSHPANQIVVQL